MRVIPDTPADWKRAKGQRLPDRDYVTVPELAQYYGMTYTMMLRRLRAWRIPVMRPTVAMTLIRHDIALDLPSHAGMQKEPW